MPSPRQKFGTAAERAAETYLLSRGYVMIDRHVTSRFGEIDLLAMDGQVLVAVEVKARRSRRFGTAVEAVTPKKIEAIYATLAEYIQTHQPQCDSFRIDLVTIDRQQEKNRLRLIRSVGE